MTSASRRVFVVELPAMPGDLRVLRCRGYSSPACAAEIRQRAGNGLHSLMKVSSEIVFCVLISGATLATLSYCDFGPHHEELSYLPGGIRGELTPAEGTTEPEVMTAPEVPGLTHAPFAVDGPQAMPGGQVRTVCAPVSHDQPNGQPALVPEKASCVERTPPDYPAESHP